MMLCYISILEEATHGQHPHCDVFKNVTAWDIPHGMSVYPSLLITSQKWDWGGGGGGVSPKLFLNSK